MRIWEYGATKVVTDPMLKLAAAVLVSAGRDAVKRADIDAIAFLRSDLGSVFCDCVGLDWQAVDRLARQIDLAGNKWQQMANKPTF